ncbi:RimJ/RimL family protein N-acetyltransferase [Stackebrandtia albiflava]|uniref:RimJ/RimL family protein N-acetyltransferase n=1 Tax=Stackebrandtia albiflava TaxID=406432 RepID=A0A562V4M4_9ACTN|nr:GNAT family N-acetyltransferase [Stackebrandtia albiflava]TWJ12844.1 RimJ/RimL family protein N-acetyltransferase [Stackebrandtia albiflava]
MEPIQLTTPAATGATGDASGPLVLRAPRESDLPDFSEMFADAEIVRFTLVPVPWGTEHRDGYLERVASAWHAGSPRWTIADSRDRLCGTVGLNVSGHSAELVYQTAPWARRQAVALRACHTALVWAADTLEVSRFTWSAIVGNHLSLLLALRLGFQPEGVTRAGAMQRGTPVDTWTAGMLPGELRALDDPPPGYALARRRAEVFAAPQPRLTTALPELTLRPLTAGDVDRVAQASRDPQTMRWTTVPRPYKRFHAEGFVERIAPDGWRRGTTAIFALADADDAYCGTVDIRLHADDPTEADVGFVTAPWARGRGYMPAAVNAVCDFGFDRLGVERIEWHANAGNVASRRVAEKCGFTMEGTVRGGLTGPQGRLDAWQAALLKGDGR